MGETLRQLLLLQEYDIKTREHWQQLQMLPQEIERAEAKLIQGENYGKELRETLQKKKVEEQSLECEQKQLSEKRIQLRLKLAKAKNQIQAEAGEKEINGLLSQEERLQNQQIALLYGIDELEKEVERQTLAQQALRTERESQMEYLKKRKQLIQNDLNDSKFKAESIAKTLSKTCLEHYHHTQKSVGHGLYLVPLEGNKCTGCHMHLPDAVLQEVRQTPEPTVCCDFCRRILYLTHGEEDPEGES